MQTSVMFEISVIETKKMIKDKYVWIHKWLSSWQYTVFGHKMLHTGYYLDTILVKFKTFNRNPL